MSLLRKIRKEKQSPNPLLEQNKKDLIINIITAIGIALFFLLLILAKQNIKENVFEVDFKVITMMLLGISLLIVEIAYKKDSNKLAVISIELLVLSCYVLSVPYFINLLNIEFNKYILYALSVIEVYFIFKIVIVYTIGRKNYVKSLSDIAEIVKEEEPVKKEASKKVKEKDVL